MKKILVTGGVGFIGSNLIKGLKEKEFEVFSLDNYSTGDKKNEIPGVTYINDDIINIFKLDKDFDTCFHLAAQSRVQPSFENPEESLRGKCSWNFKSYGMGS
jgi:UDP-glucose 4-epimerase